MLYIILEKDLETEVVSVHSVYDDEATAVDAMESLIESTEDYGYKMDTSVSTLRWFLWEK
jgi:hypothetical protein